MNNAETMGTVGTGGPDEPADAQLGKRRDAWAREHVRNLTRGTDGPVAAQRRDAPEAESPVAWRRLPSGGRLAFVGDVVLKLHPPGADHEALARRLRGVTAPVLQPCFVQPFVTDGEHLGRSPDGVLVTAWPRLPVLHHDDRDVPWAAAGTQLAQLHRRTLTPGHRPSSLPVHGGGLRLDRALARARAGVAPDGPVGLECDPTARTLLDALGGTLATELAEQQVAPGLLAVVHGDWHLGQLARTRDGLRLLDIDDVGTGDPAWDLGRPAGFWAAGLLDDDAWVTFLTAYRQASGPGVPAAGDPWPALDLPARCAVYIGAVQALRPGPTRDPSAADALVAACRGM